MLNKKSARLFELFEFCVGICFMIVGALLITKEELFLISFMAIIIGFVLILFVMKISIESREEFTNSNTNQLCHCEGNCSGENYSVSLDKEDLLSLADILERVRIQTFYNSKLGKAYIFWARIYNRLREEYLEKYFESENELPGPYEEIA